MARTLTRQAVDLEPAMANLVKRYQFRDRNETVAYGLSVSQAYSLRALHQNGPLTMGELATELHLTVSTLTRVVDQLVEKQLVDRSGPGLLGEVAGDHHRLNTKRFTGGDETTAPLGRPRSNTAVDMSQLAMPQLGEVLHDQFAATLVVVDDDVDA